MENKQLRGKAKRISRRFREQAARMDGLETTLAELQNQLDNKDQKIKDQETTLAVSRDRLNDKAGQLKEKESENRALKKELSYRSIRMALKFRGLLQKIRRQV